MFMRKAGEVCSQIHVQRQEEGNSAIMAYLFISLLFISVRDSTQVLVYVREILRYVTHIHTHHKSCFSLS